MDKVALITGGSRGIGYGISEALAREGFQLAINGVRNESKVKDTIKSLESLGVKVIYCQGDVSQTQDRAAIMEKINHHFGRLNVLVNNAGVAPKVRNDILKTTEESFEHVLKTNLYSAYFLSQAAANWFIQQQSKGDKGFFTIVNIGSISATVASINRGEYCVAKAGMAMVSTLFAARLGEHEIPVYEVRPGIVKTDMTAGVREKYDKLFAEGIAPQKRWGTPEDMGKAVASLCRGDFPYSTGEVIMVDGGFTIKRL